MRFSNQYSAILICGFLAATLGCQSAQKPSTFLPPVQAQAPAVLAGAANPNPQKPGASGNASQGQESQTRESQTRAQAAQALAVDPVGDLIAEVEKEYRAGQDNYRDGHMEAAKLNFDSAFNELLGSGFDLQSDDRLEAELNRILDGVNELEIAALQQGDGFSEQQSEPAPIDEANEATPAVDERVKAKAEAEIKSTRSDLPLMMTDQVAGYINYFSNRGRGTIEHALARSGQYEDMIRRTLKQEGVPQDLIYLAQAESGFHSLAVSRAGARGIWQFMASRAQGYGLERNWWMDERQDPEKATRAAAHHLHDLYNQFGDWYLAMAAYNSGPGTVQSAVKRTGYADFWELYRRNVLPKETRNYVPIILAVTIMAKNPEQYGLASVVKEKPVPYDTVKIDYPVDLRLVAECVDASAADLQDLNPSLLRLTTPKFQGNGSGRGNEFQLHLPAGTAAKFESAVASIPVDKRVWWRYHKVQAGETLASIARTYHTAPKSIAEANDLDGGALAPESRLIIPIAPGKVTDLTTYARAITHYKIRKGDTVESVAANFGVSAKMIRGWNRLKGDSLAGRKILLVHLPVSPGARETQVASKHSAHKAGRGSTEQASARTSSRTSATQTSGTTRASAAPQRTASTSNHAQAQAAASGLVHHKVKPGETLYSIANSYNTTVTALKHDNRNTATLRPGMILVIRDVR
jgi:membrane-bound lytic murein transglycosylase D